MSFPNHLDSITSFLAMEVFGRAQELEKQGHSILHLEFGEPDVSPPPVVGRRLQQVANQHFGYTNTCGIAELREAVAERHTRLVQLCPPNLTYPMAVRITRSEPDLGGATARGSGGFGSTGT